MPRNSRSGLEAALVENCPLQSREGGIIRAGFQRRTGRPSRSGCRRQAMDRAISGRAKRPRTGISNLKVGFNKVFGYYIEVTNSHGHKIPENYIRKQTVKNAERYITPELKEYEEKVLTADERSKELEYELFIELREFRRRPGPTTASHRRGIGTTRCAGGPGRFGAISKLLSTDVGRRTVAFDPRWPASGARQSDDRRLVCAQRHASLRPTMG